MGDRVQARRSEGVGYAIPRRESDCTGQRPSWFPFQIEVEACEGDEPDPIPLSDRDLTIGDADAIPWWPF
jgi:hypothetical protein